MTHEQQEAFNREVHHVLSYLMQFRPATDSVRASLTRMGEAVRMQDEGRRLGEEQRLDALRAQRSRLIPRRIRLEGLLHEIKHPNRTSRVTPDERAIAESRERQAQADFEKLTKELASVEAEIAALEAA